MIILGAKGFAKEVLEVVLETTNSDQVAFYDDINLDRTNLFEQFPILHSAREAKKFMLANGMHFTIGIGGPLLRFKVNRKLKDIGGILTTTISKKANIGSFEVNIGEGCNILSGAVISNSVKIGQGCILYYNSIITHDCQIGQFVEISPSANILGRVFIDDFTSIGANATVLPDLRIGKYAVIGAGAVVTKDIKDYEVVAGVPARKISTNKIEKQL